MCACLCVYVPYSVCPLTSFMRVAASRQACTAAGCELSHIDTTLLITCLPLLLWPQTVMRQVIVICKPHSWAESLRAFSRITFVYWNLSRHNWGILPRVSCSVSHRCFFFFFWGGGNVLLYNSESLLRIKFLWRRWSPLHTYIVERERLFCNNIKTM